MRSILVLSAALSACAFGQLTYPGQVTRPPIQRPDRPAITPFNQDAATWNGPLATLPGDESVYRTFAAGILMPAHREISPGSKLIGFELTIQTAGNVTRIGSLQAFYSSPNGRVAGNCIGRPVGTRVQIFARNGYAIRGARCGWEHQLTGFQAVFGRILPDGTLSATDIYESQLHGANGQLLDGGDLPFCGIAVNATVGVRGLALLVSRDQVQTQRPALVPATRLQSSSVIHGTPAAASQVAGQPNAAIPGLAPASLPVQPGAPAAAAAMIPGLAPVGDSPVVAPFAPAAADPLSDSRIADLLRKSSESLIFVETGSGQGSGFTCNLNGKRVLVTNQHVIDGNPAARFTTLTRTEVKTGAARAAAAHDLIAYDAPDATSAFDAVPDFAQTVSVGDDVVVLGNTEGERVIKPLLGKVVGIGPNLVEISSEFLPGNSGSPIVHLKSGQVIGVATYAIVRRVNSLTGAEQPSVRRFGFRLDSVQNWQPVQWPIYQAEAAATKKVSDFSSAIIALITDIRGGRFDATRHADSRLRPAISHIVTLRTRKNLGEADRMRLAQNFMGDLRNVSQRDVEDLRPRLRYDYFQRELAEETKFRAELHSSLGEAMRNLR